MSHLSPSFTRFSRSFWALPIPAVLVFLAMIASDCSGDDTPAVTPTPPSTATPGTPPAATGTPSSGALPKLALQQVVGGLTRPTFVTHAGDVPAVAVAEFVWMALLGLAKDSRRLFEQQREGIWRLPRARRIAGTTLVLLGLGRIGSEVARRAAAFGVRQVVALKGTVALWSPKVLRAGMGAHFALHLVEGQSPEALEALAVPMLATSSHASTVLHEAELPAPAAWVFGHEGQGIAAALQQRCAMTLAIPQPGGEESLNEIGRASCRERVSSPV